MPLNTRQQAFVNGILAGKSATKAYQDAYGVGQDSAERAASRLLRNVEVARALETTRERLQERTEISLARWLEELALIGFSDVTQYDVDPMGGIAVKPSVRPEVTRVVSSVKTRTYYGPKGDSTVETEFKLHDKLAALEKIGRHMGFYPKEFGGEGAPNGRTPAVIRKDGEKTVIDWGDGLRIEL